MIEQTVLGKTGVKVSIACLGAGGRSKLGQAAGASREDSVNVVKAAVDMGVTMIDTAARYGTEPIVGAAIKGIRDKLVISTKSLVVKGTQGPGGNDYLTAEELRSSVENSLRNLGTDFIDVFHLHGVDQGQYRYCVDVLLPELERLRSAGKVRFLGITERYNVDTTHEMLRLATGDDCWDVVMVGLNFINQTALAEVLPNTRKRGIGTMCMYAVRWGLVDRRQAGVLIDELVRRGEVDRASIDAADPLGFLVEDGRPIPLTQAAYRYCRHAPGIDVVMTGTGNLKHLEENIRAIAMPPLPEPVAAKLKTMFGNVSSVSGNPLPAAA